MSNYCFNEFMSGSRKQMDAVQIFMTDLGQSAELSGGVLRPR